MNINIIVAYCKNKGIGFNNTIPWKIKSDLKKFYQLTKGNNNNAIIMGKNTWLSLNCKPLKMRDNLILSSSLNFEKISINNEIVKTFNNIENVLNYCRKKNYTDVWIIGGQQIYSSFLNNENVNKIYVTEIDNNYKCDTFFPNFEENYRCILKQTHLLNKNYNEYNDLITCDIWDKIYIKK